MRASAPRITILATTFFTTTAAFAGDPSFTPITELGSELYLGQYPGGLYPGGANDPPIEHATVGRARSFGIDPLDTAGQPDPAGKFVFLSVGMSNTNQEFGGTNSPTQYQSYSFMGQAAAHPAVNHSSMVLFNGARGGQSAATWDDLNDANYARVANELQQNSLSEAQVRVAWLKVANPGPNTSLPAAGADANTLVAQMGNIVRSMKQHYPNLETVFISSRIYAGYATTPLNPEPYAYESGFAVKRVIEAQISQMNGGAPDALAGDLDYTDGAAPWLAWGPYLWADGANPREDGLAWFPQDFAADGTHPSAAGQEKVGRLLMRQMITSPFSRQWFLSTRPGDANLDHVVDLTDFNILASNFAQAGKTWSTADFNYDGRVTLADFNILASNFGLSAGADGVVDPEDWAALASAVPEPMTGVGLALLGLLARRRRL